MPTTSRATPRYVYKIEANDVWSVALAAGRYGGSPDDVRDGFIHFSTAAQVPGTHAKYFAHRSDLVLAQIDVARLGEALRFEASRGGDLFPHLYAALDMAAVMWTRPLEAGAEGRVRFPVEMV